MPPAPGESTAAAPVLSLEAQAQPRSLPQQRQRQRQQQQQLQQQQQQQEPLKIGDAICLYTSVGLVGEGAGYIHAPQAADGGVFVQPVANRIDPRLENVQTCVFEIYVPWDYKNQKRYTASSERAKALEERAEELTAKLQALAVRAASLDQKNNNRASVPAKPAAAFRRNGRTTVAPTVPNVQPAITDDDAVATLQARQAALREELHVVAAERDVAELEAKRFFKQARADLVNNTQEQTRQTGKPLIFGDTIQLRHLFTNMFVRTDTSGTASLEYSGLAVKLADESDRACLFRIMPRFKVRAIGDEVRSGDQILLVSERAPGQFLGLSDSTFTLRPGVPALEARLYHGLHEVCVTAVAPTWHVERFAGSLPQEIKAARKLFVRGGDFVQLFDKEKDGFLAADLVVDDANRHESPDPSASHRPGLQSAAAAYLNCGVDEDGGVQEESKTYWQVLYQRRCIDGSVLLGDPPQTIVLRSPILGTYLAARPAPSLARVEQGASATGNAPADETRLLEACLVDSPNDPLAAFELVPFQDGRLKGVASTFEDGGYCSLRHVATQTFLHTTRRPLGAVGVQTAQQEREGVQGARARERHSFVVGFTPRPTYEDVFIIRLVQDTDCDDFNLVYSTLPLLRVLRNYVQPAVVGALPSVVAAGGPQALLDAAARSPAESVRWATDGARVVQRGKELLKMLALFLLDQDADDFEWGKDVYKRQGLLQDLGVFELVVELVRAPLAALSSDDLRVAMLPELAELWEVAFLVLLNGAKGPHSETDRFIARFYKVFFEHTLYIKTQGATKVVLELITDSRDIIDDLIDQPNLGLGWVLGHLDHGEQVVDTVDKDYFAMLRTFCVCNGLAVRRAQELVLTKLFEDDDALRHSHLHRFGLSAHGTVEVTLGAATPRPLDALCQPIAPASVKPATTVTGPAVLESEANAKGGVPSATAVVQGADPCYYGPALAETENFYFLLAQLRLYSALADGCYAEAERCIRGILPLKVVQTAMVCDTLAYDLRAALADLLLELYLDSSDLIGVPVIERPPRCFPAAQAAAHAEAAQHASTPAGIHSVSAGSGRDRVDQGQQQAAIKASLHTFFTTTFAREARQFTEEMARIIEAEDEFEPWHSAHGEYILRVLRLVLFFVRNSIYQDPHEVGELLQLLVNNFFHVRHRLVATDVTNADDARRNDLVEHVLATALDVVAQLLNFHRYHTTLTFIADFEAVYARIGGKGGRRGRGGAAGEAAMSAARLQALTPLCEAAYFAASAEVGAPSSGAALLRATVPTKAHADAYAREIFTATAFERLCGLPSPERGGRSMLKTVLVEVATFPAEQVMRKAMHCLALSSTRHAALHDLVGDALLLVDADSLAAHAVVEDIGPIINDLAHDTQIDEKEAGELLRHLNGIRARLAQLTRISPAADSVTGTVLPEAAVAPAPHSLRLPTNVQEVFRHSHIVADILAVFDQTLDDNDLRPAPVTRLQEGLAACLDFLGELALDNPGMQRLLFQEMSGLLANVNTRPPHVAAALARALTRVFDEPLNRIQVRELHVEQVAVLSCNLFMAGHPVADLNDLLRRMAEKHGDTFMSTTHALIIRKLMQHEANVLRLLQSPAPEGDTAPVLRAFYFSLIALLATLSEGENEFIESMCQKFFALDDVLDMLVHLPDADASARSALLAFLDTVYLSEYCIAPLRHPITDARLWDVLATATDSLVSLAARAAHAPPTAEEVDRLDVAVGFLSSFFSLHYQKAGVLEMGLGAQAAAEALRSTSATGGAEGANVALLSVASMQARCSALSASLGRALIDIVVAGDGQPWMGSVQRTALLQAVFAILRGATFADQAELAETTAYIQSRAPDSHTGKGSLAVAAQATDSGSQVQAVRRRGKRQAVPQRSSLAAPSPDGMELDVLRDAAQGGTPLDEAHLNACFRRFQELFFQLHWDRNSAHHRCCRADEAEEEELTEEWPCPYLQRSTDGEPSLPNGYEFQRRLALVEAEPALLGCLLRYLAVESDVMDNRNCSDAEREAAAIACADALRVLRGLVQLRLCRLSDYEPQDYDGRKQIWDLVHAEQQRLANANAIPHVLRLLCAESEELFTDAFELLASLCAGGNPAVQAMVKRALDDASDLPCLLRVRDELHRSLALTLQRRATLSTAGLAGGPSGASSTVAKGDNVAQMLGVDGASRGGGGSLGPSRGGTFGTFATLSQTQLQELQRAFGTLLRGGARHTAPALSAAREREVTAAQCELRWLDTLCRGIMLLVEGAFSPMQDHLREQPATSLTSVNFVVEMCRLLQATYTYVTQGAAWLGLLDQILDTLAELCQGSPSNQQEAFDEQVVKCINFILAYDTGSEEQLLRLTQTKRGALTVLEAMIESNNAAAVEIARALRASLNIEELYLAMNRFYYLNMFSKVAAEHDGVPASREHLIAGFECYFVLARLGDLTGDVYRWKDASSGKAAAAVATSGDGSDAGAGNVDGRTSAADADERLAAMQRQDDAVEARIEHYLEQAAAKQPHGSTGNEARAGEAGTATWGMRQRAKAFVEFSRGALSELDTHGGEELGPTPDRFDYFQLRSASIEFVRNGDLQKVYFRRPEILLSQRQRDEILLAVNRATPQEKVRDFVQRLPAIRRKLHFQARLRRYGALRLVANGTSKTWKWISLALTLALNFLMLSAWKAPDNPVQILPNVPAYYEPAALVLGILHLAISFGVGTEYYLNNVQAGGQWGASDMYYVMFVTASAFGLAFGGFFYSFHLFHIVADNDILQRAMESLTRNGGSLFNVTLLAVAVVFNFSVVAFAFLRGTYDRTDGMFCDTLSECFVSTLSNGLRFGGGVGEGLDPALTAGSTYAGRITFELLFWALVCVIGLNLVLGIIVDSFSQLRAERAAKLDDMLNSCFICSLPAHQFDSVDGGFARHVREDHNMWSYVYYVMYLEQETQPFDRTYHELYLYQKLVVELDPAPMPIKRALCLMSAATNAGSAVEQLTAEVNLLRRDVESGLDALRRLIAAGRAEGGAGM